MESERLKARLGEMLPERELLDGKAEALEGRRPSALGEVMAIGLSLPPSSGRPGSTFTFEYRRASLPGQR